VSRLGEIAWFEISRSITLLGGGVSARMPVAESSIWLGFWITSDGDFALSKLQIPSPVIGSFGVPLALKALGGGRME